MRVARWFAAALAVIGSMTVGAYVWSGTAPAPASLVFRGGTIVTMDGDATHEALWSYNGRISALGTEQEVIEAAGQDHRVIDLEGGALLPGLIEPHTHPLATAMLGSAIDVSGFTHQTRAEVMQTLRTKATGFTPQPWIVAFGWDPVLIDDLEPPTLAELDDIAPDKPLVVLTQMAHEAFANSAALAAAGITGQTPDPPGGAFMRNANGRLNGTVHEVNAIEHLFNAMPPIPEPVATLLLRLQYNRYARAGITSIGVLGPLGRASDPIGMMRALGQEETVPVRAVVYALPTQLEAGPLPASHPDARFALRGVKFWMDGSPYTGGAAFEDPYEDTPLVRDRLHLPAGHRGALNHEPDAFNATFRRFHELGYQVAVHAQGERAIDRVLNAVGFAQSVSPRADHRHRLEHNALISDAQIARAEALGVELSFFIDHLFYYGERLPDLIGERVQRYMPVGTAMRLGHTATIHTDNPTTPIGPFRAMRTAMLRTPRSGGRPLGADEQLTAHQALSAMTLHAARQLGVDAQRGSLEVGKASDLVWLSRDPLKTPAEQFETIEVRRTWIDGQPVDTRATARANWTLAWKALQALASQ